MRLRTRLACLGVGLALATSAVVIPTVQDSSAAFTDAEHASVSMTAAELAAPIGGSCDYGLVATSATLIWEPPESVPATYTYEWEHIGPSGNTQASGTLPGGTTQYDLAAASLLGLLETNTFRVRVVSEEWTSPWLNARVTATLSLLGIAIIGSCSWQ